MHVKKEKRFPQSATRPSLCGLNITWSQESHTDLHQMLLTTPNTSPSYPYPHLTPLYNWSLYIKMLRLDCPLGQERKSNWHPHHDPESLEELVQGKPTGLDHVIAVELVGVTKDDVRCMEQWANQTLAMGKFLKSWSFLLLKIIIIIWRE